MARRRFQRGQILIRGRKGSEVWVGRWREDRSDMTSSTSSSHPSTARLHRSEVLGTLQDIPTKRLAQRILEDRLRGINSLDYQPRAQQIRFDAFAEDWIASVLPQHKPSSQSTTKSVLRNHLIPAFGKYNLQEITPALVQRFVTGLACSPKSVRNVVGIFRMLWKTATLWGHVKHKALEGIQFPRMQPVERPTFTPEQMQQIIQAAEEPFKTFFWLASETGMRVGELCGLRWEDVGEGQVFVRQSVWRGQVGTPKSLSGTRRIDISAGLAAHLQVRQPLSTVSFVFHSRTGQPWHASNVFERLRGITNRLGIPPAGLHAFRHGNATFLIGAGEDPITVAQRLGHRDATITLKVYAHARPNKGREMAERMNSAIHFVPFVPTPELQVDEPELVCA